MRKAGDIARGKVVLVFYEALRSLRVQDPITTGQKKWRRRNQEPQYKEWNGRQRNGMEDDTDACVQRIYLQDSPQGLGGCHMEETKCHKKWNGRQMGASISNTRPWVSDVAIQVSRRITIGLDDRLSILYCQARRSDETTRNTPNACHTTQPQICQSRGPLWHVIFYTSSIYSVRKILTPSSLPHFS